MTKCTTVVLFLLRTERTSNLNRCAFRQYPHVKSQFKPTPQMVADFMTKQIPRPIHEKHLHRSCGFPLFRLINLLSSLSSKGARPSVSYSASC